MTHANRNECTYHSSPPIPSPFSFSRSSSHLGFFLTRTFRPSLSPLPSADCNYTNTSNANGNITYKLACTEACTYWKFYILEYPVPLTGVCSTLPCLFNSIGVSTSTTALRNQMGMKSSTQPACWIAFNATTAGNLLILAQSFYSPTMHIGDVMIRFGMFPTCCYYNVLTILQFNYLIINCCMLVFL